MKFNIKNLDVNLKKSKKIRFCKNCVVFNLRPRISFNEDGIVQHVNGLMKNIIL